MIQVEPREFYLMRENFQNYKLVKGKSFLSQYLVQKVQIELILIIKMLKIPISGERLIFTKNK